MAGIGILATFIVVGAVLAAFDLAALSYLRWEQAEGRAQGAIEQVR